MIASRFIAMALALAVVAVAGWRPDTFAALEGVLAGYRTVDAALWQGLLAALLFAAALHVRPRGPLRVASSVTMLGIILATLTILVIAWASRWLFGRLGLDIGFAYCLLFAAAAAPADPLAVLRSLRLAGADEGLARPALAESLVASLAGVVIFAVVAMRLESTGAMPGLAGLLAQQVGGSLLLGLCLGFALLVLLRLHSHRVLVAAASFVVVGAAWWLGEILPLSGPVAAAVAGLVIAGMRYDEAEGADPRVVLPVIWSVVAEFAVVVLLAALMLALVASPATWHHYGAGAFLLPIVVLGRVLFVFPALWAFARAWRLPDELAATVSWGGYRGGLAAALALSLPPGPEATVLQAAAFVLLCFSLLLHGPVYSLVLVRRRPLSAT